MLKKEKKEKEKLAKKKEKDELKRNKLNKSEHQNIGRVSLTMAAQAQATTPPPAKSNSKFSIKGLARVNPTSFIEDYFEKKSKKAKSKKIE